MSNVPYFNARFFAKGMSVSNEFCVDANAELAFQRCGHFVRPVGITSGKAYEELQAWNGTHSDGYP